MRILLLGGYGLTGRALARSLLQHTDVYLTIAGRRMQQAVAFARELDSERVSARAVDLRAPPAGAFRDVDCVVVAAPAVGSLAPLMTCARQAGADYVNLWFSPGRQRELARMAGDFNPGGRVFLVQAGMQPGAILPLARWAAGHLDVVHAIRVFSHLPMNGARAEMADETRAELDEPFSARQLVEGRWEERPEIVVASFSRQFPRVQFFPVYLGELARLPDGHPGLRSAGFYWSLPDPAAAPVDFAGLRIEVQGVKDGRSATRAFLVWHSEGYAFTAISISATLTLTLLGRRPAPGIHLAGDVVDPGAFVRSIGGMGIQVQSSE